VTVKIVLIPDGIAQVPTEARDHSVLAGHLEQAGIPDVPGTALSGWRDVERVVHGDGSRIELRVRGEDGSLTDFPDTALDAIENAIVSNVDGLKAHPDGWRDVETVQ
jgi:hypothetical protein